MFVQISSDLKELSSIATNLGHSFRLKTFNGSQDSGKRDETSCLMLIEVFCLDFAGSGLSDGECSWEINHQVPKYLLAGGSVTVTWE